MPHQCTTCDRLFADGSTEMLSGCPDCGGNKFQFLPSGAVDGDVPSGPDEGVDDTSSPSPESTGALEFGNADSIDSDDSPRTADVEASTSDVDDPPAPARDEGDSAVPDEGTADQDQSIIDADARERAIREDSAQADARSTVISNRELRAANEQVEDGDPEDVDADREESDEETPDLAALREELNEQFESIKILEPGQYELNLMELYDREEYIVALEEDGKYAIEVPDSWREDEN